MKAENLQILRDNGFNVPEFIVVTGPKDERIKQLSAGLYAVRSSSELEDGDDKSYAGQFDTLLNVPCKDLPSAVEGVIRQGQKKGAGMRVIIQQMVASDMSGVMFTANPMGILNEAVVVIGRGLGEKVVEDRVETSTYYYNLDDDLFYYEQQEGAVLIGSELLHELIETGRKIKELFGKDMDIEFAIKDGVIHVLQSRPITTLKYKHIYILDNSNIVESYPGISLPLTHSFVKEIYRDIFRAMIGRLSGRKRLLKQMEEVFDGMVAEANGRVYYNITNWYNVLSLLPFSRRIISVWQEMLGVSNKEVSTDFKAGLWTKGRMLVSFIRYLHRTPGEMKALADRFAGLYPGYMKRVREAEGIEQLMEVYEEIDKELIPMWDITLINDMYAFIYTYLGGKRHPMEISHIRDLESMRPVKELEKLTRLMGRYGEESDEYARARDLYIDLYGDRCLEELKLETRTYRTDPYLLDDYVRAKLQESDSPYEIYDKACTSRHRKACVKGAKAARHEDGAGGKYRSFTVRRARIGIAGRELSRMNRTRIFGIVREIALKIGDILVRDGRIGDRRDVFYLTLPEIRNIIRMPGQLGELEGRISYRKLIYENYSQIPAYSRLIYGDRIVNKNIGRIQTGIVRNSKVLTGIPSSPGKVVGEVLVIDKADQLINTEGRILVTQMTDPGWVFLISRSLGIIAAKGSMLSHTAIITRELGKPSVVNVKDAEKLLKTGDRVELDAYNGTVTIL